MKKLMSILLAIALMIPNFLSLQASAAGVDVTNYAQHIVLAKAIFPEHADKLDGNTSSGSVEPQTKASEINMVIQETRTVDANTTMTYTEYDNGVITLGTARFVKDEKITVENSVSYGSYVQYTAKIVASVVEGPTFTATGVQYRIYPSAYDKITNIGNYSIPGYSSGDFECYLRENESAGQSAYASYEFDCPVGSSSYSGAVIFKLQNNSTSVEFNIW